VYYSNELIDELDLQVKLDKNMYANIQSHNVVKMLKFKKENYKLFGVYWWAVKDAIRKYVNNGAWYCGVQDDPLMKERAWHGSEYRTMVAAMFYTNDRREITSSHSWYDKEGNVHDYTLSDPDAEC